MMQVDKEEIQRLSRIELARRDFFYFCHVKAPDFYRLDREYLRYLCNELQDFYMSEDNVLLINLPP